MTCIVAGGYVQISIRNHPLFPEGMKRYCAKLPPGEMARRSRKHK